MVKRGRTWLSTMLGLLLLLQGYAVAAAPNLAPQAAATAMTMAADEPCPMHAQDRDSSPQPDCCNTDCPSMATCLLGHFAAMPDLAILIAPAPTVVPAFQATRATSRNPASPLRPPITRSA